MSDSRFDGDTGQELEAQLLQEIRVDREGLVKEAQALAQMTGTPGWKHLENFINTCIAAHHGNLLEARDLEGIRRLQERIKAYANVISYVEAVVREGEEAAHASKELETDPYEDLDPGVTDQGNP